MHTFSLAQLRAGLDRREFSSVELTQHFLGRIAAHDRLLNSFVTVTDDEALKAAHAADARIAAGSAGPLTGIPYAHKDIFCTQGVRTTCGSRMLRDFIAPYNATVHEKLQQGGAVMLGKTNMDEFAMGSTSESSHFGITRNPWNPDCVPGGSSGGSAAAVGARLAPVATGTDTGGSIRQPAAFCGITGIKPTYGRVSRYGMIAYASSLDQGGAMGASAEDCALLLQAMAGFDPLDSTSVDREVPDYRAALDADLTGLRIGLPREWFGEGLDAEVARVLEAALDEYRRLGAEVVDVSLPNSELAIPAYYVIAPAEASSNLSRYDGVRFGHRCEAPRDLEDLYKRSRGEGFGEEVKRRIMIGTYALSAGYYDAYYLKAQQIRRLIAEDFRRALSGVDVLMGPVAPFAAPAVGQMSEDPVQMYLSDIYTLSVNLAGLPGMSVPAGFAGGKPVGLQIIGNYFEEARLLNVAHRFQQATDWHTRVPAAFA
ncbi:MAG: Asp-tRNA(Asn)/Glu-tRNA(Gln) amidotransferase subunit GatA [Halothiobacillaceae bacterium]|nr:Asp-tRNA(Asn)/Glu-tRNA(Gln) amidotransferase subunit GatA [Halothiobacillaceae bacterium]